MQTDLQTPRTSIICTMVYFNLLAKDFGTMYALTVAPRDCRAGWYHPFKYRASTNYNQNRVLHKDQQDILNYSREEKRKNQPKALKHFEGSQCKNCWGKVGGSDSSWEPEFCTKTLCIWYNIYWVVEHFSLKSLLKVWLTGKLPSALLYY